MQPTARQHIFINYCGDDARGVSGRVVDWLRVGFGGERVLHDSTSLDEDTWRDRIDAALAKSAVFVALIGPRWADADNLTRLHDPHDRVRHELLGALACADITLLPTLVEGAPVPELADLPAALQALFSGRSTRLLRESCWNDDIRALSDEIAAATGLAVAPDIDIMIRARQRVAERERALQLQPEQIGAQRRSSTSWPASWRWPRPASAAPWPRRSPNWRKATRCPPKPLSSATARRKRTGARMRATASRKPRAMSPTSRCCAIRPRRQPSIARRWRPSRTTAKPRGCSARC